MSAATRPADVSLAAHLLAKGASRPQIERSLSQRRLSDDRIAATYQQALLQHGYAQAIEALLDQNMSRETTLHELEQRGLEPEVAGKIIDDLYPLRRQLRALIDWAVQMLVSGQPKSVVERKLPSEIPSAVVQAIVQAAHSVKRATFIRHGLIEMIAGVVLGSLGLVINYASYWIAGYTGTWHILTGFFVLGLVVLAHGFAKLVSN